MDTILGNEQIREIRVALANFDNEGVGLYERSVRAMINAFDNQEVVQSLYASGKFGSDTKEKLEKFVAIISEYRETYLGEDGLVNKTKNYLDEIEARNNRNLGGI